MVANHQQQNHEQSGLKPNPVVVVMVPFLAQSHLNQLLQLSFLISSYKIPVHYVSSSIHNRQVRLRQHGSAAADNIRKIQFHDIPIPLLLSPPPNPKASDKFPTHLMPSYKAALQLREPVAALLRELSQTASRIIVIHDTLMASVVQESASVSNAETYGFHPTSAFSSFFGLWEFMGKPFQIETQVPKLPSYDGCFTSEFVDFMVYQAEFMKLKAGDLHNTSRLIEDSYVKLLEQIHDNKKQWAIGPLNRLTICDQRNSNRQDKCLEWLDKQTPNSVLYISFGTTTTLTDEQIKELATGLEQSQTKFIWVLREADRSNIFTEAGRVQLPEGFEERMEGVGMIVREWVPQLEILGHPSTGGFLSHCGWNSCLESISMGVPIVAWPMHSDQPRNAVFVAEVLRVGILIDKWPHKNDIISSLTIREAVRGLMALEEGEELRRRAEELGRAIQQSVTEDGASNKELESFIAHITR